MIGKLKMMRIEEEEMEKKEKGKGGERGVIIKKD